MKAFKRNAVIVTVVLFVCIAAYLNWIYGRDVPEFEDDYVPTDHLTDLPNEPPDDSGGSAGLFYESGGTVNAHFAEARLNRQQARDAAVETLATVQSAVGASQEVVDSALSKIMEIASNSQQEAELETLIRAKGFTDCVVYITDDGVRVTVPAPAAGLSSVDVAKITDVIVSETAFGVTDLRVIEVRA